MALRVKEKSWNENREEDGDLEASSESDSSDSEIEFDPNFKVKKRNKSKKRLECEKCGKVYANHNAFHYHVNNSISCSPTIKKYKVKFFF